MPTTYTRYPVVDVPVQVLLALEHGGSRAVRVWNVGAAPVWIGDDDVTIDGGFRLDPGDDAYVFADVDELWAIGRSSTVVAVSEQR